MKKTLFILLTLLVTVLQAQTVKIPISNDIRERNGKQYYVHTVERGQTVYSISKAYGVTVKEIYFENPEAKNGIVVGQKLWIPTVNKENEMRQETKASSFDFFYHIASRNETFKHIGSIYLIPERYIRLANPTLKEPLREGEYVKVPVESAFPVLDGHPAENINHDSETDVEEEARRYSAAGGSGEIPKYKPPLPKKREPSTVQTTTRNTTVPKARPQNASGSNYPVQTATTVQVEGQVAFNPDVPVIPDYRHVVVMGETLESIAKKYHITVRQLKEVNPGLLVAAQGQRLRLPVTAKVPGYNNTTSYTYPAGGEKSKPTKVTKNENGNGPVTPPVSTGQTQNRQQEPAFYLHKVKKKETLYSIAREYGVTLNDLFDNNPGLSVNIKPGQTIKVPKKKISTDFILYTPPKNIRQKKLARLFHIPASLLVHYNPMLGKKIYAGQPVKIPVGSKALVISEEEQKKQTVQIVSKPEQAPEPVFRQCQKHPRFARRHYNIALMIPLYLEETDSLDPVKFMEKGEKTFLPFRFVKFLEGSLMAIDSLKAMGMDVSFYVYDVDNKLTKTAEVLSRPELREMNLIIGPFFSRSFRQVALFSQQFNIPIVNPLTYRGEVVNNYNGVIKVKPALDKQPGLVADIIEKYFKNDKIFLISQTSYKDAERVMALRNSIEKIMPGEVKVPNTDLINLGYGVAMRDENFTSDAPLPACSFEGKTVDPELLKAFPGDSSIFSNSLIKINYITDSLHPFLNNASVLRENLVIIYGDNKGYLMDAVNRLNRLTDTFDIKIMGLPLWEKIKNPNYNQLNNLRTVYPATEYISLNDSMTATFEDRFLKKYFTLPEKYGMEGFDITWYFARQLYNLGEDFMPCLPENGEKRMTTYFKFEPATLNENSYENSYWNMLQITNKTLIKLPDFTFFLNDN